ncbi:MAG TPA: pilus (MSHA type) biogenesis protein MshL [Gammaproteobacteria bacterium]|nr:pilus (MSHA type) biogenesis protein MshL [Gammaproteobacteria bacterium]
MRTSTVLHRSLPAMLVMLFIAGCDNLPPLKNTLDKIQQEIPAPTKSEAKKSPTPVPADVSAALLPSISLNAPAMPKIADEQHFDISVNEVPANQFFMSLVDGTKYNMVVHPEVTGNITLNLKNATIPEVLEAARDVYGYEFLRTDYGFEVLPARLEARVYQINYLNVSRRGESSTFVSSGTLQTVNGAGQNQSQQTGGGYGSPVTSDSSNSRRAVVGTEISTVQPETSFWKELQNAVQAIVGTNPGRSVVVNPESGVVVVRALPNELREVETFLRATQLVTQRQVILEAKVLEVQLNEGYQTGINWGALSGDFAAFQTGGGSNLNPSNATGLNSTAGTNTLISPGKAAVTSALTQAFGGVFALAVNSSNFQAFVELLKTQGNVQVLSSPRVSTMNNQKALIKVGTDQFFVTNISTTTVTGTATTSTPNIELTPFFSGIALDVTPQISEQGDVTLHIHPSVSVVAEDQRTFSVGGVTQQFPLAKTTVRESDSVVRAKSGQMVVIGGLMQDSTNDNDAETPKLGDLPVIGAFFGHKRQATLKSELVILLRPIVVEGEDDWMNAANESKASFQRMREQLDKWTEHRQDPAAPYGTTTP